MSLGSTHLTTGTGLASRTTTIREEEERLLNLHQQHLAEQAQSGSTHRLDDTEQSIPWGSFNLPFGLRIGSAERYVPLPTCLINAPSVWQGKCWRIELHGLVRLGHPIGFDILGDVILGRGGEPSQAPDLDLEPYGALEKGVSRQHALLRPTAHALYLIDLNSTNGTRYNMAIVSSGIARSIGSSDTITLGNLSFEIRIVDAPVIR